VLSDMDQIAPLGNLNPPGHVFPTDHTGGRGIVNA